MLLDGDGLCFRGGTHHVNRLGNDVIDLNRSQLDMDFTFHSPSIFGIPVDGTLTSGINMCLVRP